jgi:hypothetical protein
MLSRHAGKRRDLHASRREDRGGSSRDRAATRWGSQKLIDDKSGLIDDECVRSDERRSVKGARTGIVPLTKCRKS